MIHYLNNKWVKKEEAKISAFDLSLTRGLAAFEFLRTYNGKPFFLDDHLNRFYNGLKILQLKPIKTKTQIKKIIYEGIKKNNFDNLNIKIIQTVGEGKEGLFPKQGEGDLIILFTSIQPYPQKFYTQGIKLITYPYLRPLPLTKSTNYLIGILALKKAREKGAFEALYTDNKKIYEGVTSNFFAVINNRLVTPKNNILLGITRKVVIKLAKKLNIKVEERDLYLKEIKNFSEAFITATNKEIMPVIEINNFKINQGRVGGVTQLLIKKWKTFVEEY